jgi:hypothetical protein
MMPKPIFPRNLTELTLWLLRRKLVRQPRIGVAKDAFVVPDSFFEPLPEEILKAFGCE